MPVIGPERLVKLQHHGEGIRNVRRILVKGRVVLMSGQLICCRYVYWHMSYVADF